MRIKLAKVDSKWFHVRFQAHASCEDVYSINLKSPSDVMHLQVSRLSDGRDRDLQGRQFETRSKGVSIV